LIVDDDRAIGDVVAEVLADEGYEVEVAADGKQALAICGGRGAPDLIVVDLQMPVMDGVEFAKAKAGNPALSRVPLCIMTASGPSASIPMGTAAVLRKPLGIAELISTVKRFW
jgi:two-component system chemotaxis response regulator CheY